MLLKIIIFLTWCFTFHQVTQGYCLFQEFEIAEGEMVRDMCHKCICVKTSETSSQYCFSCDTSPCVTDPILIDTVNNATNSWKARPYFEFLEMTIDDVKRSKLGTFFPSNTDEHMIPLQENITENGCVPLLGEEINDTVLLSSCHEESNSSSLSFEDRNCSTPSSFIANNEQLPEFFDARTKWPNLILPPQNQKRCGASWAYSTAGVVSDRVAIQSNGNYKAAMSLQHLFLAQGNKDGCNGGYIDRAWNFTEENGIISEDCFNSIRSGKNSSEFCCVDQCNAECSRHLVMVTNTEGVYRIPNNEKDIMVEIMKNGPVQTVMKIKQDFFLYSSGIYRYSTTDDTGQSDIGYHSVRIIGWGENVLDSGETLKYWVCVNSWGIHWGEQGYFKIERGQFEFTVASRIRSVEKIDPSKPNKQYKDALYKSLATNPTITTIVTTQVKVTVTGITKGRRKMNTYKISQTIKLEHAFKLKHCRATAMRENQARSVIYSGTHVLTFLLVFQIFMFFGT